MESSLDDRFIIFVREPCGPGCGPQLAERPVAICASYAEARRIRRELHSVARECVIRYVGPAGGGD